MAKLKDKMIEEKSFKEQEPVTGYSFDEKRHIHMMGDKPLIGVTTSLQIIAKPALIQWSANMAVEYIQSFFPILEPNTATNKNWDDIFKEAKTAHRKKKEKAAEQGTDVHAMIEDWIKLAIKNNDGIFIGEMPIVNDPEAKQLAHFWNWAVENKVKFLESEKNVWSHDLWIGGIVDMIFEMDGKRYVGDIKTSSGIYNEHFFQMAAYDLCLEEMGVKDFSGYIVINLKKDGTMDTKMATDMELNRQAYKHALGLYKIVNSFA